MYFVFTKGAKKALSSDSSWNDAKAAWVSALIAGGTAVLVAFVALPLLRWRASKAYDKCICASCNQLSMSVHFVYDRITHALGLQHVASSVAADATQQQGIVVPCQHHCPLK